MNVYLIPGQGADHRLFSKLTLDDNFKTYVIEFEVPHKAYSMTQYAQQLSNQIDKTQPFALVGVSIGGMLATEMTDFLNPEKTIVISSAKSKNEIPKLYTYQRYFPIYKLVPAWLSKIGGQILQPLFEPARDKEKEIFVKMLKAKNALFMKRTISMIVNWDRENYDPSIISIHGDKDNTLPIRYVKFDHLVKGGSHLMILTQADELSSLLNELLS